ncbi:hypothetical protein [Alienimonas chondri]|uniref:hypothetical protein n=1 Tax=Alienimonas chondri TaxID=2681879 RepID=UPI00148985B6|nr:hypothetical protein [Alienimonas chondri]
MNELPPERLARCIFVASCLGALPPMLLPALAFERFGYGAVAGAAAVSVLASVLIAALVGIPAQALVERWAERADVHPRQAERIGLLFGFVSGGGVGFLALVLPGVLINTMFPGH